MQVLQAIKVLVDEMAQVMRSIDGIEVWNDLEIKI